jgi:hypothetical protein
LRNPKKRFGMAIISDPIREKQECNISAEVEYD